MGFQTMLSPIDAFKNSVDPAGLMHDAKGGFVENAVDPGHLWYPAVSGEKVQASSSTQASGPRPAAPQSPQSIVGGSADGARRSSSTNAGVLYGASTSDQQAQSGLKTTLGS